MRERSPGMMQCWPSGHVMWVVITQEPCEMQVLSPWIWGRAWVSATPMRCLEGIRTGDAYRHQATPWRERFHRSQQHKHCDLWHVRYNLILYLLQGYCWSLSNFIGWIRSTMVDSNAMGITMCMKNVPFITWPHFVAFVFSGGMLWADVFSQNSSKS